MKKLIFTFCLFLSLPVVSQTLKGSWKGELKTPQTNLALNLHFSFEEGVWSGTMDSPNQGAFGIPFDKVSYVENKLEASISQLSLSISGVVSKSSIQATFKQGLFTQDLELSKMEASKPKRPQMPQAPYSYRQEELSFNSSQEGVHLHATLSLPKQEGKHPAILLIAGSGPLDRDETIYEHKPFAVLADFFCKQGFAVLRYDKRGVGQSTGNYATATTLDFAEDARTAYHFLQQHPEIQTDQIGLIGHSEGGIIAPILASKEKDIKYIVLLAAPGVNGNLLLKEQYEDLLAYQEMPNELKTALLNCQIQLNNYVFNFAQQEDFEAKLAKEVKKIIAQNKLEEVYPEKVQKKLLTQLSSDWYRSFLLLDPAKYLSQVNCPILALNGENDKQVAADTNLKAIQRAVSTKDLLYTKKYPQLNHLFQSSKKGTPEEYYQIEETFSESVMKDIYQWIRTKLK